MLGFYGVVPALKATTAANPAPPPPSNPHSPTPPFGRLFLSVNLSLGKSTDPLPPLTPTQPSTSGPPGDEIITLKVGWSARNANSWGNTNCDQEILWDKGKNILRLRFWKAAVLARKHHRVYNQLHVMVVPSGALCNRLGIFGFRVFAKWEYEALDQLEAHI